MTSGYVGPQSYKTDGMRMLEKMAPILFLIPVVNIFAFFVVMPIYVWMSISHRKRLEKEARGES